VREISWRLTSEWACGSCHVTRLALGGFQGGTQASTKPL
jgi:hypothetical protein